MDKTEKTEYHVSHELEVEAAGPEMSRTERKMLARRHRIEGASLGRGAFSRERGYNPIDQLRSMGWGYD